MPFSGPSFFGSGIVAKDRAELFRPDHLNSPGIPCDALPVTVNHLDVVGLRSRFMPSETMVERFLMRLCQVE